MISSTADLVFLAGTSRASLIALIGRFWVPVLLGNTVGGVLVFTLISYSKSEQQRFPGVRVLSLRQLFFSWKGGQPYDPPTNAEA